ncbi:MAG: putative lipid II flippase FtsW [Nitrospirae bacterium]|nr:putative lipid II flippase FtsW [Nitrospirota bacterium]
MKQGPDKTILVVVILLIIIGIIAVYSATSVIPPDKAEKYQQKGKVVNPFEYLERQLLTVLAGVAALFLAYKMKLQYVKSAAIPLLLISLLALLLVFTKLGVTAGGSRRWLRLWPSTFQPSEMAKLAMVIFLSWYMSASFYKNSKALLFILPILITFIFQAIFLMQPDLGSAISIGSLTIMLLFLSGARLRYILGVLVISAPVIFFLLLDPYRWGRIISFLDPWKYSTKEGHQLIQSLIALGSGGLKGVGLGDGRQKLLYLPEVHTDFIFASIGEELGFVFAGVVVALFLILFVRGVKIANKTSDNFSYYLAFGVSMMIALQALINFGVVTGMIPTKGLPLPFVSYGGSSLLVNMAAIGLLLNISRSNIMYDMNRGGDMNNPSTPELSIANTVRDRGYRHRFYRRR